MPASPLDDLGDAVKDAAYVSVGLGVLAFQRLQVRRQELAKALEQHTGGGSPLGPLGELVGDRLKLVEERLGALRDRD